MKMPKWARILISGIIAFFLAAVTYPSITGPGVPLHPVMLTYLFCISVIPFLLVCFFTGRNKIVEIIGWSLQFIVLASMFMILVPIGLLFVIVRIILKRRKRSV